MTFIYFVNIFVYKILRIKIIIRIAFFAAAAAVSGVLISCEKN